jgi:S-adenosylmethionine:tRNA ribosyltransferase-isomerase
MDASRLDYELPEELIAQSPLPDRAGARLLCLRRFGTEFEHGQVRQLPERMPPALWVLNDTKVIPARVFASKPSGGRVEFLLVERISAEPGSEERWSALARTHKGLRTGMRLSTPQGELQLTVLAMLGDGQVEVLVQASGGVEQALTRVGQVPLPPYIRRAPDAADQTRYQTVFAATPGAVAAPTAGLHLSEALLAELVQHGHELAFVTLHVGPGTFAPLRAATLSEHRMHAERYSVPEATALAIARARREGRPIVSVGTTVLRTLEAARNAAGEVEPGSGATSIFIYPPYRVRAADALLTNFHLPRSTLLALVMAFAGEDTTRRAYGEAVAARYRFFSYGDAMLITAEP